jgi:hypothetical protein
MPITYVIDEKLKLVRTAVSGAITAPQIVGHLNSLLRAEAMELCEIIDVRGVTPPYLSSSEVWQAAQAVLSIGLKSTPAPRAIVVDQDVVFGINRMFATLVEDTYPIRIFRDMETAEHWLLVEHHSESV